MYTAPRALAASLFGSGSWRHPRCAYAPEIVVLFKEHQKPTCGYNTWTGVT